MEGMPYSALSCLSHSLFFSFFVSRVSSLSADLLHYPSSLPPYATALTKQGTLIARRRGKKEKRRGFESLSRSLSVSLFAHLPKRINTRRLPVSFC